MKLRYLLLIAIGVAIGILSQGELPGRLKSFWQERSIGASAPTSRRAPESMTHGERKAILNWETDKRAFRAAHKRMEEAHSALLGGGYLFDKGAANNARGKIQSLLARINSDDPLGAASALNAAQTAMRNFEATCRWQAGIPHPRFRNIRSSHSEGQWEANEGYQFANPGTADLTVRYVGKPVRCGSCAGSGQRLVNATCLACNGRGRVTDEIGTTGNFIGDIANIAGKKRNARRMQTERKCYQCNGAGRKQEYQQCPSCGGSGTIYR